MRISDWSSDVCSSDLRQVTLPSGQGLSAFNRDVRWARQKAKLMGMVDGSVRNLWRLTPSGKRDLRNAAPGIVITVFETALGQALWAEAEAAYALIEDGSINSMILSPPYPIATAKRSEEHTSELQSLMRISYAVFCLKKK